MSSIDDAPDLSELVKAKAVLEERNAELAELAERWRTAITNAPIGMALVSLEGRWLEVNRALCKLVGYPREELLELDFQMITHPDDLDKDLALVGEMLAGTRETYQMEKRYLHSGGGIVPVMLSVSMVKNQDGSPKYFVSQIEDITERKRTHGELERSNRELAQFAYMASHDLRTPLRTVAGSIGLLRRAIPEDALTPAMTQFVASANDGVRRMESLIDDILALSKASSKPLSLESVDVSEVAESVFAESADELERIGGRGDLGSGLPVLVADRRRLTQVFANLVQNAIKYRSEERDLVIRIYGERVGNENQIAVVDNGIGIAPQHAERIFKIFQRLHTDEAYEGTGLGLAMIEAIVGRLGGRVWLDLTETVEGQGSAFRIAFPIPT